MDSPSVWPRSSDSAHRPAGLRGALQPLQRMRDPPPKEAFTGHRDLKPDVQRLRVVAGLHLDEGAALCLGQHRPRVGAGVHAADGELLARDHPVDLEGGLELGHRPGALLHIADVTSLLERAVDALEGDRVRPPFGLAVGVGGEAPDHIQRRVDERLLPARRRHGPILRRWDSKAPTPGRWPRSAGGRSYTSCGPPEEPLVQRMTIYGVSFDMVGKQPIVLLKTVDGNKFLPIWIGHPEAAAILKKPQGASTPRPIAPDLLSDVLDQIDAKCEKVSVTELRDNTFFASITVSMNGSEMEIDSRPSDALALAVRTSAPIFAADDVIEESAIEFEGEEVEDQEQVVEKFKDFLDNVTPEDFASGEGEI